MRSSDASTRAEPCSARTASQTRAVSCSSTDVRRRNVSSSGASGERNSERKYSARKRSSPPGIACAGSSPARSRAASAPRRMPAAQPSQRSSRSAASSSVSAASGARRSASLSRGLRARSAARNSSSFPPARSRAIGRLGERRPKSTSADPGGTWSTRVEIVLVALRERIRWALSTTRTTSPVERSRAASRDNSVRQSFDRREAGAVRSVGRMPSSAAASRPSRTAASSSVSSTETHAKGRGSRSAHCAASVVLPVAGRCRQGHERHRCRTQPVHERRPRHRPGRRGGHANLCFDDVGRLASRSPGARARHPFSMRARPMRF